MALALCLSLMPTAALAAEDTTEPSTQLTEPTPVPEEPEEPETPDQPEETKTPDPSEDPPQDEEPSAAEESAPVGAMLSAAATTGEEHTHYLCGGDTCNKVGHDDEGNKKVTFQPWDGSSTNGTFYLTKDWTLTSTITVPQGNSLTLCLNGHSITLGSQTQSVVDGSHDVFSVQRRATFTLCDCKDENGNYGTIGHYNPTENQGPGVNVSGTFNMYGGKIFQNQVRFYDGNPRGYGGGVLVSRTGTFNMFGGEITGNTAKSGGGVYVDGTFSMSGGTIYDNAGERGGGVYVTPNGMFNMSGSAAITGNTGTYGGVYVDGTFSMSGGTICGNTVTGNGGGVYVDSGTFNMSGSAAITGNTVTGNGGGVYVRGIAKKMNVSGDVKIENNWKGGTLNADTGLYGKGDNGSANNLYLDTGKIVTIDDSDGLSSNARISITTVDKPKNDKNVQIASGAKDGVDYTQIFTPDEADKGYTVSRTAFDNLNLHQHSWGYTNDGADTIKATCTDPTCSSPNGGSVTIKAPDESTLTYTGQGHPATFENLLTTGDQVSAITYTQTKPTQQQLEIGATPTNAGTYTASIIVGRATASVTYEIAKATPSVGNWQGYPQAQSVFSGNAIQNPTSLMIYLDGNPSNLISVNQLKFNWYNATKNGNDYVKNGDALGKNPTDVGDYIIEAVFAGDDNINAATSELGLTISKAQDANNGVSIEVPLTVYPASGAYTYDVDIAKALNNIPHGGGLEPNTAFGGISTNLDLVKSTSWDNGKLYVTMRPLANITGTTLGSITVNLTSKNYTVVPVVVNITLQPKREVPNISVSMDNWTYGENAKTPRYTAMAGAEATVTYAAQGSSDFSTTVPTDAGNYTVKVQYEAAIEIYTGTANFTIAPKKLTKDDLTYSGPITKVYDTNTNAPSGLTVSVKPDSLEGSDTLTVSGTLTYNSANVNEAKQIIFTPTAITTGNYALAGTEVLTITGATITKAAQAPLTVTSTSATYGEDLALTVSGGTGNGAVTYTVTNGTGEATIVDGSKLHPTKAGTVSVTATKSGGDNYEDVTSAAKEITIGRADYNGPASKTVNIVKGRSTAQTGTLTAADFFPEGQMPDGAKITDAVPDSIHSNMMSTAGAGASGDFIYASKTNITAASNENWTITISSKNYTDITATLTFHPTDKLVQDGFKFENGSVTKTYGDADFTLTTTDKAEGSTVTYESSKPAVATVDSTGKVTIKGAGTAVITARASATAEYDEAAATCNLTVGKKTVTVKAKDQTAYVGDKAPVLGTDSYTVSGLVGEEKLTTQPTVKYVDADGKEIAPDMTKTGEVKISASGAVASGNYTIRYEDGKLTVSTRPSSGGSHASSYTVSVDKTENGAITVSPKSASKGDTVTITVKPDSGYQLDDLTVTDKNGKELKLTDKGNGKYNFTMPASRVEINVAFVKEVETSPFSDVSTSAYYYEAVKWAQEKGITGGVGNGLFGPNQPCTRAQIVTFLWRATGSPVVNYAMNMSDVPEGSYYAEAVRWALSEGITTGTTENTFSPDSECTRAQAVAFLFRYAASEAVTLQELVSGFSDADSVPGYALPAMNWALAEEIVQGNGSKLMPNDSCTRAQIVTFLFRAYQGK